MELERRIVQRIPPAKNIPALSQAYQIYDELEDTIRQMDEKIGEVVKEHQAEFLLAYRNHIRTMKEELTSIKQKAEEQQKKMLSNDRAVYLEKQLILFRQQALKLYDRLEDKTQECQSHKSQVKEFQRVKNIVEKENRQLLKQNKYLEAQIALLEDRNKEITQQLSALKTELQTNRETFKQASKGQTLQSYQLTDNIQSLPKPKEIFNVSTNSRKYSKIAPLKFQPEVETDSKVSKASNVSKGRKISQEWMDHQLKNWFLECIETIRKQVAQRKVYGYKSEDLNGIASWEEFRMIDKLRLLEMFMQNEKLLVWMYEKIFPSRLTQIESYLTSKIQNAFQSREKSKSAHISIDDVGIQFSKTDKGANQILMDDLNNEKILPKILPLSNKKSLKKKYDVRQRIDIRNGKLNLSDIQNDF